MELHALDLNAAVAQSHDDAFGRGGRDFEAVGQGFALDDERVVARRREAIFQALEDRPAVVANLRRLAVDGRWAAHDAASEDLPDGLVAEADAEQRDVAGERGDQLQRDASLVGRARPRRDDDAVGPYLLLDLPDRHLVVAPHLDLGAKLAEVLDEVVGERVVVVYQKDAHKNFRAWLARASRPVRAGMSLDTEQLHVEDERGVTRNLRGLAHGAVAERGRDDEPPPAADLHRPDALVPTFDDHAATEDEGERLPAVTRAVELRPVQESARVVDDRRLPRRRAGACAHDQIRVLESGGRRHLLARRAAPARREQVERARAHQRDDDDRGNCPRPVTARPAAGPVCGLAHLRDAGGFPPARAPLSTLRQCTPPVTRLLPLQSFNPP